MNEKEDAKIGRACLWFVRWHTGALLICLILTWIFGDRNQWSIGILIASLLGGIPIAAWLTRAEKKQEEANQPNL